MYVSVFVWSNVLVLFPVLITVFERSKLVTPLSPAVRFEKKFKFFFFVCLLIRGASALSSSIIFRVV